MSNTAREPSIPRRPRRSLKAVLDSIARRQQRSGQPELSEDEAMELAVRETRAARQERHERGVL